MGLCLYIIVIPITILQSSAWKKRILWTSVSYVPILLKHKEIKALESGFMHSDIFYEKPFLFKNQKANREMSKAYSSMAIPKNHYK